MRLLNDTGLIQILPPQPDDYIEGIHLFPRRYNLPDTISPVTKAIEENKTYNKIIAEQGACILKVLTNYRRETKRRALKEVKQHYQDSSVYYFYTIPELAVYKVWFQPDKNKIKTAHIRLVTGYRLWEHFYYPDFYDLGIPGCKDI
jgi:hypothetical protein